LGMQDRGVYFSEEAARDGDDMYPFSLLLYKAAQNALPTGSGTS
jgi:hypothetical protein